MHRYAPPVNTFAGIDSNSTPWAGGWSRAWAENQPDLAHDCRKAVRDV
ncbi:MAG: hypothetical protein RJB01_1722 [Actinomycetota bacterium]